MGRKQMGRRHSFMNQAKERIKEKSKGWDHTFTKTNPIASVVNTYLEIQLDQFGEIYRQQSVSAEILSVEKQEFWVVTCPYSWYKDIPFFLSIFNSSSIIFQNSVFLLSISY